MRTKKFWVATAERAVRTFAQTFGSLLIVGAFSETDWATGWQAASTAALLSVAMSVGASQVGGEGPSLAGEVVTPE